MLEMLDIVFKLFLSLVVGSLIGAEREYREKSAGLRTIALVCMGSMLFTVFSGLFDPVRGDPTRVAAGIVTGIGFLGAGVILRERREVWGLTTAAIIWLVAALGIGIGVGEYLAVGLATAGTLAVLWGFPRIGLISKARDTYTYEVIAPIHESKFAALESMFEDAGLTLTKQTLAKNGKNMIITWHAYGRPEGHQRLMHRLMMDEDVSEVNIS